MAGDRLAAYPTDHAQARLDAYLGDLAQHLHGPRRRRAQIMAELRDGLQLAVAGRTARGIPQDQAVADAIAEFGSPQAVAAAFAGELSTSYARHTIAWYIATGPLVGLWWLLLLQPHPWRTGLLALLAAIPVVPLVAIAIATAAGTFATTGRLMRWLPEASPHRALTAAIAIAALAVAGDLTVITLYIGSSGPGRPLAVLAVTASLIRIGCSLVAIPHTAVMRRHSTDHP